jgi:hypothetical protein
LFSPNLAGSLDVDKLLCRYEIPLSKNSLEKHSLGAVIDHECLDDALLPHEHGTEIEIVRLVVLVVDYVAGMVYRCGVDID